ncbi:MAG: chromosome segregation protein SMC, partial [Candidatus Omnitrophota bacterium]|nr:chromosome segregation protein SMC [Candidatus Omnitrophota bacterium]
MHFKKLELFGFKSFANRTVLNFEPGVTAIVGPNGCGKSNIADAIKWVLGEQRPRELRGLEMQDVIFNGTDSRSSVGLAEVSLTLSNSSKLLPVDYEEVTISRRVFRSGESLYLINKTPCRLKDITELFMGTGIGTNAYSMMAQGKIDLIISSKPEERRFVFDEAAGITKFKSKKKEALRKLEQTESNLQRIDDIISEVKRQIGSIERQAKKAQRYQGLFEALKKLELKLAAYEYHQIKDRKVVSEKEISLQTGQRDSAAKQVDVIRNELAELEKQLEDATAELSGFQERSIIIDSTIDKNQHQIAINKERSAEIDQQEGLLNREIEAVIKKIDGLNERISRQDKEIKEFRDKMLARQELFSKKESTLAGINKQLKLNQENITRSRNQLIDVASSLAKSRNELAKVSVNLQNAEARERRLKLEQVNVRKEKNSLEERLSGISANEQNYQAAVENLREKQEADFSRLQLLEQETISLNDELNSKKNQLALKVSKKEILEDLKTRYEGFQRGSKSILLAKNRDIPELSGIIGVIGGLITVKKGYQLAIEAALGNYLQSILVNSLTDVEKAASYLKKENLGRAAFLVKNLLIVETPDAVKEKDNIEGSFGKAMDFISTEPSLDAVMSYLLKNTLIVKTFQQALHLSNNSVFKGYKLVTLDGELIIEGKEIIAGSTGQEQAEGMISRQAQCDRLSEEIDSLNSAIAWDLQELEQRNIRRNELQKIDSAVRKSLHNEELNLANIINDGNNLTAGQKKLTGELSVLEVEIEEINSEIEQLRQAEERLKSSEGEIEEKDSQSHSLVISSQEVIASKEKEKEIIIIETAELKAELSAFNERERDFINTLEMLKTSFKEQNQSLELKRSQIETGRCRKEELEAEIGNLKKSLQELSVERIEAKEAAAGLKSRNQDLKDKITAKRDLFDEKEVLIDEIKNKIHSFNLSMAEISYKFSGLIDRISREYKVNLEEEQVEITDVADWDKMRKDILELKAKVEVIGPVSLVAIEEHEELKDRCSFLVSQKQDLENAKQSLHLAIQKINKTTRKLFLESFEKVQAAFKDFFKLLFGGGNAQLMLSEENNVLESG